MKKIGVIGAGAWGTALGQVLAQNSEEYERDVMIWAREADVAAAINVNHENPTYLPGIKLSENLKATDSLKEIAASDILLLATPAQHMRSIIKDLPSDSIDAKPLVICAKGIELDTGLLMSQVVEEVLPEATIAVLSGPTFAREVAAGMPSAVTIAAEDSDVAQELQAALGAKRFRPYITDDVIGAQLGGALKNVIAIACGIVHGRRMGENARAALLTRGVAEIARLGVAMDAKKETLLGMCGVGDLVLTCTSMQSRNFSLGVKLGEGQTLEEILGHRNSVTEGVHSSKAALALAKKHAVDMPITSAVNKCLHEGVSIDDAIEQMLNRPFRY